MVATVKSRNFKLCCIWLSMVQPIHIDLLIADNEINDLKVEARTMDDFALMARLIDLLIFQFYFLVGVDEAAIATAQKLTRRLLST